jgi:RNA-directed DNA polymerase
MGQSCVTAKSALEVAQRTRGYKHFDIPLSKEACEALVTDPAAVSRHAFYPFLRHDLVRYRIKRIAGGRLRKTPKVREIRYASHADAAIYTYYNCVLAERYEKALCAANVDDASIAFRPLGKSNIDFAKEAFEWIDGNRPCTALGFDVQDFFGSLDHEILKAKWSRLLGVTHLPDDHYAVFRSLTKHASVELIAARKRLGISRQALGRRKRLCEPADFRMLRNEGFVAVNRSAKGIPQGSPVSALLSNVYMLEFDANIKQKILAVGGLYKRYCDDILIVVPDHLAEEMKTFVAEELSKLKLAMQPTKTLECKFGSAIANEPLQYLGLVYDGSKTYLRPSGVARYYKKMRSGVRLHTSAKTLDGSTPIVKQRRKHLLHQYTEHAPKGHRNYLTYVKTAEQRAASKAIRQQLKRHIKRFNKLTSG